MPAIFKTTVRALAPLIAVSLGACAMLPDLLREVAIRATGNASQSPPPIAASASPSGQPDQGQPVEPMEIRDLLNGVMNALLIADEDQSATAVLAYVHKSLKDRTGTALTADVRQFSFKKAHQNARFYALPVQVTRVRENNGTSIGFGETAEMGRTEDHFLAKKEGEVGLPAPMTVFIPTSGGPPKIAYLGSL